MARTSGSSFRLSWLRSECPKPQCEKFRLRVVCRSCAQKSASHRVANHKRVSQRLDKQYNLRDFVFGSENQWSSSGLDGSCYIPGNFGAKPAYRFLNEPEPNTKVKAPKLERGEEEKLEVMVLIVDDLCGFNARTQNARDVLQPYLDYYTRDTLVNFGMLENKLRDANVGFELQRAPTRQY